MVVAVPQVRLDAHPLAWGMRGELGVQIRGHMILGTGTGGEEFNGGGVGYLYEFMFIRHRVGLQVGSFMGMWVLDQECTDESCPDDVRFYVTPTVRAIAGFTYIYFHLGFNLFIGSTAIPSFNAGLHFKI